MSVVPLQVDNELIEMFREMRGQTLEPADSFQPPKRKTGKRLSAYERFLVKYNDLENEADNLNSQDFIYFFRETAKQVGYKYVVSNFQKDLGIFKKALENYSKQELCLMIEFLFLSEQDYLRKDTLSPNLLISGWCNTIHADSLLWADDKYVPQSKKKTKNVREWTGDTEKSIVGKWRK